MKYEIKTGKITKQKAKKKRCVAANCGLALDRWSYAIDRQCARAFSACA